MACILEENHVCHMTTAPYHPRPNGVAERAVRILKKNREQKPRRHTAKPHFEGFISLPIYFNQEQQVAGRDVAGISIEGEIKSLLSR